MVKSTLPEVHSGQSEYGLPPRIESRIIRNLETGCWIWQGSTGNGYGRVQHDGKVHLVHRVVYELLVEPIHSGLVIDHLCRSRACCNPDHLEPVTNAENIRRGAASTRDGLLSPKEFCVNGHPRNPDSIKYSATGARKSCLECARIHSDKYYREKRANKPPVECSVCGKHMHAMYVKKHEREIHGLEA